LTRRALKGMAQIPGLDIFGIKDPDSPGFPHKGGVIVFGFKAYLPGIIAKKLACADGIGVRYGCHCTHLLVKQLLNISPFLERFQVLLLTLFHRIELPGMVRVSLGIENSEKDIDTLIHALGKIQKKPHAAIKKQMHDFILTTTRTVYEKF
jgi:selenocysteine lyase/cysteine desulfurase